MRQSYAPLFYADNCAYAFKSHLLLSSICLGVTIAIAWPAAFCAVPAYVYSVLVRI